MIAAGTRVGPYELLSQIGAGGMGEVWRAQHVEIKSQVAVKLLLGGRTDPEAEARFLREAMATARIRHPGVIAVTDYGRRTDGGAYLVMELLSGEPLSRRIESGIDGPLALEIGIQIAEALAAAHAAGVVHRDLKPANIFLVPDRAVRCGVRVKLLDFGIAKELDLAMAATALTASGAMVGTPLYMAPEQMASQFGAVDARTDLYALGVVLYELVTGRPPFRGPTLGDLVAQHTSIAPASPSTHTQIAPRLEALILHLLKKQSADRPSSAVSVVRVLAALRDGRAPDDDDDDRALGRTLDTLEGAALPAPVVASAPTLPSAAIPSLRPVERLPRRRLPWLVLAGGVAIASTSAAFVWSRRDVSAPSLDVAKTSDVELDAACRRGNDLACHGAADRALHASPPDLPRAFGQLGVACDRDAPRACTSMALMYFHGAGVRADYVKARQLAVHACEQANADGCVLATKLVKAGIGGPVALDQASTYQAIGCAYGAAAACRDASSAYKFGIGVERNAGTAKELASRAHQLAERGCARDDARACAVLGELLQSGTLGTPDLARGAVEQERACTLGDLEACGDAAQAFMLGQGVAKDPKRARMLLERGCERLPGACVGLASNLILGTLDKTDPVAAIAMATRACEQGGDLFCDTLGMLHWYGLGGPRDLKLASRLIDRACRAGGMDACVLGAALAEQSGEPIAPATITGIATACEGGNAMACQKAGDHAAGRGELPLAASDYERGCDMSQQYGCAQFAGMLLDGKGVAIDTARGRALLELTCKNGNPVACFDYGNRLRDGRGLPPDAANALHAFERACESGGAGACRSAAELLSGGRSPLTANPERAAALRKQGCSIDPQTCPK